MYVDIEQKLYEKVRALVEKDKIEYPTIQNFINKAVREKLSSLTKRGK